MKSFLWFFRNGAVALWSLLCFSLPAIYASPSQSQTAQRMDIRDFVRQLFVHGTPFEEASQYGAEEVPILLQMLNDSAEESYWPNIAVVLCVIGDERAVDPLIAFIEQKTSDTLSYSHHKAITSTLIAFGYLINKSGSPKALEYLQASVNPRVWRERNLTWKSSYQASSEDRDLELSTVAILGLGVSGHPDAGKTLRTLQERASEPGIQSFRVQMSEVVKQALEAHDFISQSGLKAYYQQRAEQE